MEIETSLIRSARISLQPSASRRFGSGKGVKVKIVTCPAPR